MAPTMTTPHPTTEVADSRLFAALYDPFLWLGEKLGLAALRRGLLAGARGTVLEIGAGTGLNLPHYPAGLEQLVLTEPGERIGARIDLGRAPVDLDDADVRLLKAPAEQLPVEDASVDTVISTLVLCTVGDPRLALREVRRVLKPGGRLLFLEHVRADTGWLRGLQSRFVEPWAAFAGGCRCDRPTLPLIRDVLRLDSVDHGRWRGMPALVRPLVWGTAVNQVPPPPSP